MSLRINVLAVALLAASTAGLAAADEPLPPMRLFDDAPSASQLPQSKPTVAELRQARALERRRQRIARMEANAWAGYSPLRPTVSANPYTQLHSPPGRPTRIWTLWDYVER